MDGRADMQNDLPKISVIIPSFNQGEYIEETVLSIINQNYPDFEIIIIDGGSTDNTIDIIRKYEDKLVYWVSEPDHGQSDAINKGAEQATGEIIGWLNSDDLYYEGALRAMGEAFAGNPDAVLIYGSGAKIADSENVIKVIPARPFSRSKISRVLYFLQPSMMFRLHDFRSVDGVDKMLHYVMDWDLVLKLIVRGKVVSIHSSIGMLRRHAGAKTIGPQWQAAVEAAMVAKKHNGFFDINYLSYIVRRIVAGWGNSIARRVLRPLVDSFFDRWGRKYGYLVKIWPDVNEN